MSLFELIMIAIGLAMDAFAVAVCMGLALPKAKWGKAFIIGLYFGVFQSAMPMIGYFLGVQFADRITSIDHWIAFVLLSFIGGKMVFESFGKEERMSDVSLRPGKMLPLAVATSIDALAVGVSFAFMQEPIVPVSSLIGVVTLILSMLGVKLGRLCGARFQSKAELAGGLILILMGLKILLEHLGMFGFS